MTFPRQSQNSSGIPSPPHTPHSSKILLSQSQNSSAISVHPHSYIAPGPSQIPHASITASPPHSPKQS